MEKKYYIIVCLKLDCPYEYVFGTYHPMIAGDPPSFARDQPYALQAIDWCIVSGLRSTFHHADTLESRDDCDCSFGCAAWFCSFYDPGWRQHMFEKRNYADEDDTCPVSCRVRPGGIRFHQMMMVRPSLPVEGLP